MAISKALENKIKKYISNRSVRGGGVYRLSGKYTDFCASNSVSVILFNTDGSDPSPLKEEDFNCEIRDGTSFERKNGIFSFVIDPFWESKERAYKEEPVYITIDELKKDTERVRKENGLSTRSCLYASSVSKEYETAVNYGMWLVPELLCEVCEIIGTKSEKLEMWIPHNKRQPAVIKGTNKYGTHLAFVLGTARNFKEE